MRDRDDTIPAAVGPAPEGLPAGLDRAAELYASHAEALYCYCRCLAAEPAAAADAVCDTFAVLAARDGALPGGRQLRAWLFAVARNECLRAIGSGRATRAAGFPPASAGHPAADPAADQQLARAWRALGGLPPAVRDLLLLTWHGLDLRECALVLGISRGQASRLLARAGSGLRVPPQPLAGIMAGPLPAAALDSALSQDPVSAGQRALAAGRAEPFRDRDGFPVPLAMRASRPDRLRSRLPLFAAATAVAGALALSGGMLAVMSGNYSPGTLPAWTALTTQQPAATTPAPSASAPAATTPAPPPAGRSAAPDVAAAAITEIQVSPSQLTLGRPGQPLTLANPGRSPMSWALTLPPDLAVAMNGPASGTLQPGASTRVYLIYAGRGIARGEPETVRVSPGDVAVTVIVP